jgi:hypothetical protein
MSRYSRYSHLDSQVDRDQIAALQKLLKERHNRLPSEFQVNQLVTRPPSAAPLSIVGVYFTRPDPKGPLFVRYRLSDGSNAVSGDLRLLVGEDSGLPPVER